MSDTSEAASDSQVRTCQVPQSDGSRAGLAGLWGVSALPNGGQGDVSAASLGERRRKVRTPAVNPGPGSYRLLAMLIRLGVAGVEPLACGLRLSTGSTYSHLRRLEKAGLVWRVPLRDGGGSAVAISRMGALRVRDEGLPAVFPKSQAPSTGEHARAVSWVAARFELRDGWAWFGPAELRRDKATWRVQRSDGKGHMPDLGLLNRGQRIAIEVELHSKVPDRLRGILRGYRWKIDGGDLAAVGYVTTRLAVARLVRREGNAALLGEPLRIITLDDIIDMARKAARGEP